MKTLIGLALGAALFASPLAAGAQTTPAPSNGLVVLKGMITTQGRISFGNGVASVGVKDTGLYRVTLSHSTTGCAFAVTVGGAAPGYATVDYTRASTTQVDVHVFDGTGAPANLPFFFTANCAS